MLRPERMSRVSVTGSKDVMEDVIETAHDLNILHVTEYDGAWEGFEPGNPIAGADEASDKLVTVRSLESILDVDEDDAGPTRLVTDEALEEELEEIRQEVNELDDRRDELRDELRSVEEEIDTFEPFAALGIDLDLLSGYDSLEVAVGEGDSEEIKRALVDADEIRAHELFTEGDAVAIFVAPAEDGVTVEDVLVGVQFQGYAIPDAEGSPDEYLSELKHRKQQLESKLTTVQDELEDLKLDVAGFLLAAEEKLAIQVQKSEAPLSFATTENAFVAEGWIPTEEFVELADALESAVGDHVDVEELERAQYTSDGHGTEPEPVEGGGNVPGEPAAADGGGEARADGGVVTMGDDDPPVLQNNPKLIKPFELLTQAVGRPNYSELDPTLVLFLTFPLMFGFMIGDVGYGLIYTGIGYYLYANFDSETFKNFGIVAAAAGIMTTVFGVLYGEIFGLHLVTTHFWEPLFGHPPIEKGLSPATVEWAEAWFVLTALFGVVHLDIGWTFEFIENRALHGFGEAMEETGSWLLALNGLWIYIFSRLHYPGPKPDLLFTAFGSGDGAAIALGFTGLPAWAGWIGIGMVALGMLLLAVGPTYELIEIHQVLAHALSYLRIGAVLLAKAGMAFAVNLLFFGAYETHGEFHFMLSHGPEYVLSHHSEATILFPGMIHGGIAAALFGIVVLLIGHLVVLLLGITSAGIQSIRLEYFEFFSKFYDGGGTPYTPFGREREHTAED